MNRVFRRIMSLLSFGVVAVGCSENRLSRHPVAGRVTFRGQPVEYGAISFIPDESIGKIAPTAMTRVENGKFATPREAGPVAGMYHVRVLGFDKARAKIDPGTGLLDTPPLFPEYEMAVEIPPPNDRLDIEVPADPERPNR